MTTANRKLPEETTYEIAESELDAAREALERVEQGADDKAALHRYLTALRTRNVAWREMNRARRRARREQAAEQNGMRVVTLEGSDLVRFHDMIRDLDRMINDGSIETLRIAIDGEGVKAKPGTATWSPGFGQPEGTSNGSNRDGQLARIAEAAYGAAVSAQGDAARSYAAGIENLARFLAGQRPAGTTLQIILDEAQRRANGQH